MRLAASKSPIGPGRGLAAGVPPRSGIFDFPLSLVGDAAFLGFWRVEDGHVTESGGDISQIDDQSGNGRHATQSDGLKKPFLDTTTYTNWAASFFAAQVMEIDAALAAVAASNNWTMWIVRKLATTAGNQASLAIGATGGYALTVEGATEKVRHQGIGVVNDGAATTDRRLIIAQRIAGVDHMSIDGVEVTMSASAGTGTPSGRTTIGALLVDLTFPGEFDYFECAIMSRLLSGGAPGVGNPLTGECAQLVTYYQARY